MMKKVRLSNMELLRIFAVSFYCNCTHRSIKNTSMEFRV